MSRGCQRAESVGTAVAGGGAAWRLFSVETRRLDLSKSAVNRYLRAIWPSSGLGFGLMFPILSTRFGKK
jgi:hypothetical protein